MDSSFTSDGSTKLLSVILLICSVASGLRANSLADAVTALREGDLASAENALRSELKANPVDAEALGLLGIVLDGERKFDEADAAYRRALQLNPNSPGLQNNYGNHLLTAGELNAAQAVFAKLQAANPLNTNASLQLARIAVEQQHPSKALEYLAKIPEADGSGAGPTLVHIEALYLAGQPAAAETLVSKLMPLAHKDARVASSLALTLSDVHQFARAGELFSIALSISNGPAEYVRAIADVADRLLEQSGYKDAADLLAPVAPATNSVELRTKLAIAVAHTESARAALQLLDEIPEAQRTGEYFLARAEMLDASGQAEEAAATLHLALAAAPENPALYRETVLFLIKNDHLAEAVRLASQAAHQLPDDRESQLLNATTLELAQKTDESTAALSEIERRWPSWPNSWLAHAIILETHRQYDEACQLSQKAISLGAHVSEAYFNLAESLLYSAPDQLDAAAKNARLAVALAPQDPWARSLAGRIDFKTKHYNAAVDELQQAIRLRPNLAEAHYVLAQTYKALGKDEQSRQELQQVTLIHQKFPNEEADTTNVKRTLFAVRPLDAH